MFIREWAEKNKESPLRGDANEFQKQCKRTEAKIMDQMENILY